MSRHFAWGGWCLLAQGTGGSLQTALGLFVSELEWLPCTKGLWGGMVTSTDPAWVEQLEGGELGCTRPQHKAWLLFLCAACVKCGTQCLERTASKQGVNRSKDFLLSQLPLPRSAQPSDIATGICCLQGSHSRLRLDVCKAGS